jgi:hypothetical protein
LALLTLTGTGCLKREDPKSYANKVRNQEDAAAAFRDMGVKLTEKKYPPYGKGWVLNLSGKPISDDVFDRMQRLGNVTDLDLSKTNLTDEQMARLADPAVGGILVNLDVSNTAVTDAGLEKLTNLRFLKSLNLTGTKVTPAAVERFKKSRANTAWFKSPNIRL